MSKWIRPGGAAAFAVVMLAVGLFWFLLADRLLRAGIETAGTKIMGAKVELAAADLTFSPLGFRLVKLQVTDPQQPMQNLFELDSAAGNLELLPLLMGQVIVDEMSATGVRLHTERNNSGAIDKPAEQASPQEQPAEKSGLDLAAMADKLPSAEELLAREPLATLEQTKIFEDRLKNQRGEFEQNLAALPDEQKIRDYERRLKEITGGNIQSLEDAQRREKELETIKDEIRSDRDSLLKVRDQVRGAKDMVGEQYSALKQAPGEDWERLKSKYGFDATGAGNITRLLFGDTAAVWLQRLLTWSTQINRLLPADSNEETPPALKPPRGEGRYIRFPSSDPLPDFLLRKALLTLELDAGDIELSVTDATYQPQILGRPMRLHASGKNLKNADRIQFDGIINHVNPKSIRDNLQWSVSGWQVADVALSKNTSIPLQLTKAQGEFSGSLQLAGQKLTADTRAAFSNAHWAAPAQEGLTGRVIKTLSTVDRFNVQAGIQGDIVSPELSLRSDLDEQLRHAVAGELKNAQAELEQQVKTHLNAELAKAAGPYQEHVAFLSATEGAMEQRIAQLNTMLKAELKSAVDSQKKEATDKLKDKLKGLKF